jgi:hypothetical protein
MFLNAAGRQDDLDFSYFGLGTTLEGMLVGTNGMSPSVENRISESRNGLCIDGSKIACCIISDLTGWLSF